MHFADPIVEERLRGLLEHQAAVILARAGRGEEAASLARAAARLLARHGSAEELAQARETVEAVTGQMWTDPDASREDPGGGGKH